MKKLVMILALFGALSLVSIASAQFTSSQTWGSFGNGAGQFYGMSGIAADASGNIYVAELDNRVQKFNENGIYITQFNISARDIAIDSAGNIYATVNDSVEKFNSAGTLLNTWGSTGTETGHFKFPTGIALDSAGNIYISDMDNNRVQKLDASGNYITSWGTLGSGNGNLSSPAGIIVSGNSVYVADMGNYRIQKFDLNGNYVSSLGSKGTGNTEFNSSIGVSSDSAGNIYVADYYNGRVLEYDSNFTYVTQYTGLSYPTTLDIVNNSLYVLDSGSYQAVHYDTTLPPVNKSELQLWTFDASKVSAVPDNVYTASKDIPYKSNLSLTYNSTLGSVDSTCRSNDSGETYITGAYPTVNENLTFTMGVDSNSPWSYGYLRTSVAYIGVRHASDGSYGIESYWTDDNGSLLNSNFQIPATSVVNNRVTVSIHSYDSNRTNVITAEPGLSVTTPYRTKTTRELPYTNVIQPLVFIDCYASGADGRVNVHLYNITQSIPRDTITPYARNDIMGFGLDYPNVTNNQKGTDFLISHGQNATAYVSGTNMGNSTDIAYDNSLFNNGFEEGIHFWPGLATESLEQAKATIDSQIGTANTTFGSIPVSWSSSENKDNVTHAIYAYNKYGALYRNGMMGTGYISNIDTLSNETWAWWSEGSAHGAVCPCFTHQTDNYPAIPYSIDPELFKTFVTNLNSKGINLVGFSKWYYSSMAQTATTDILQSNASGLKFQLNSSGGYPVNLNVNTTISPSHLDCNGVSIPFNKTSDGVQFRSVGNGTYTLTTVEISPEANFTAKQTGSLTVQFNDISSNNPNKWNWNFGDGINSTEQNPTHTYSLAGNYTVNLTATNGAGSSVKLMNITVKAIPPFPGCTNSSIDLNHDGFCEDINGNGKLDFNDVVKYYANMDWIKQNSLVTFFDFNNNGSIDFNDVVKLYAKI